MQLSQHFRTLIAQETPAGRRQRMVPGAAYGLIIASTFALVGSIVNQVSFPELPVAVDWRSLLGTWLFLAVWLGLGGAFINWFTQTEEGISISVLIMMVMALTAGALTFDGSLPVQFGKLALLVLPVLAVSLLATITLRWLGVRHAGLLEKEPSKKRRGLTLLMAGAVTIGAVTGFAMNRWTDATLWAVQDIHRRFETAAADPSRADRLLPLSDLSDLASHLGQPYTLYGHPSGQSVVAVETVTTFEDGYQVTCILLVFPDLSPFLDACAEGRDVVLQGNQ